MEQDNLFDADYIVFIRDWYGHRHIPCNTEAKVWDAIGHCAIGGLYEVSSPTGKNVNDFIPF